jgi:hypothetical protein
MSDVIWMDPAEMRATAGVIAEQALRIQETVTGTRTACACEVPRSLIGWLDAELVAIATEAMQVAVAYLTEVVDVVRRADQILANQSLVAAQAGLLPPDTGLVLAPTGALVGGLVLGGTTAELTSPSATGAPLVGGFLLSGTTEEMTTPGLGSVEYTSAEAWYKGPNFTPGLIGSIGTGPAAALGDPAADSIRTILSPRGSGLVYDNGGWVDERGARGTSLPAMGNYPGTDELDN